MGKLKLGILGNGYLADIIVEAGLKGMLDEYELVGVLGRTREKTELLAKKRRVSGMRHHRRASGAVP